MTKTKIVVTVGPACDSEEILEAMIKVGARAFRFNMKHNSQRWHSTRMERLKRAAKKAGEPVAIIMDLQGPEVRVGRFKGRVAEKRIRAGEEYVFAKRENGKKVIPLDSERLIQALHPGDRLLLNGGQLEFEVKKKREGEVVAMALGEGVVEERKGVNFPQLEVDLPTLLKTDLEHLSLAAKEGIDFVALSFIRRAEDIKVLRVEMEKRKVKAGVIAKIETRRAVENFEEILKVVDGVMVARGDLGIEVEIEKVPYLQKEMIRKCRQAGKPVIVATEMLESMVTNLSPTRAEVSDVANAVYDGTDALMLSSETAMGQFPTRVVKMMAQIAEFIEKKRIDEEMKIESRDLTEAVVEAAVRLAEKDYKFKKKLVGFVVMTDEGETARLLSRYRNQLPIFGVTQDKKVRDQLCLSFGVVPFYFRFPKGQLHSVKLVLEFLKKKGVLEAGQKVILVHGEGWGTPGRTNAVRIQEVY